MNVKFWGVRGSIPCPYPDYMIYGGNTSCVEIDVAGKTIIIDAGSGLRALGKDLIARNISQTIMLFSHTHWDHVNGFPFFAPLYKENWEIDLYAASFQDNKTLQQVLDAQMSAPLFPKALEDAKAKLHFHMISQEGAFHLLDGQVSVETAVLNHPNGAVGYRLTCNGSSVAYISDTEHKPDQVDSSVLKLMAGCDLVIYDAMFGGDEFSNCVGWGHSTWREAVRLAKIADVKKIALFHHSPDHNDDVMADIEKKAQSLFPNAFAAKEHSRIKI